MKLADYLKKGVTQISVRDGEATAVNPYRIIHGYNQKEWTDFELYRIANRIPCPAIPDGVYGVEQVEEIEQTYWGDWREITPEIEWIKDIPNLIKFRTVLVLKDQPEETDKVSQSELDKFSEKLIEAEPQINDLLKRSTDLLNKVQQAKSNQPEEKPEGENETIAAKLRNMLSPAYGLADMVLLLPKTEQADQLLKEQAIQCNKNMDVIESLLLEFDKLCEPEGETIERSTEEGLPNAIDYLTQSQEWKKWPERTEPHICYYVAPDRIAKLMQEHAQNRMSEYKAGLIAKLENSLKNKDAHHMIYRADGIEEAIELIKNS